MSAQLEPAFRKDFLLAGRAKVTLVSKKTGTRFTYKVTKSRDNLHFVAVLVGPDNQGDYRYMGSIFDETRFRSTKGSKVGPDAPSFRAFAWAWEHLDSDHFELWHSGSCSRCGRELTNPESIQRGLGPTCAEKA